MLATAQLASILPACLLLGAQIPCRTGLPSRPRLSACPLRDISAGGLRGILPSLAPTARRHGMGSPEPSNVALIGAHRHSDAERWASGRRGASGVSSPKRRCVRSPGGNAASINCPGAVSLPAGPIRSAAGGFGTGNPLPGQHQLPTRLAHRASGARAAANGPSTWPADAPCRRRRGGGSS